jgi:hypothetical protein
MPVARMAASFFIRSAFLPALTHRVMKIYATMRFVREELGLGDLYFLDKVLWGFFISLSEIKFMRPFPS